jgi:putative ABC transport system permease protein
MRPLGEALVRGVRIEGQQASAAEALPLVSVVSVGPRYFDVVGARLIAGRRLLAHDLEQPGDSIVVNERFARVHFQDEPAVGKHILIAPDEPADTAAARWATIVGVVGNVRQRLLPSGEFDPVVYRPYSEDPPQMMRVIARPTSDTEAAIAFVREQVRSLDADRPLFAISTVDQALSRQRWPQRVFGSMFAIFASIAMLLATCGLYGVTAYAVSRRTREIAVRVALGANARTIWWAVTGTTLRQLAIGVVLGTAGAGAVATALPAILVGTGGANLLGFGAVVIVLIGAGIVASAVPARRAIRLDAAAALQAD